MSDTKIKRVTSKNRCLTSNEFQTVIDSRAKKHNIKLPIKFKNLKHNIKISDSDLTKLYENTDYNHRKTQGQFFTPPAIAESMVSYGLNKDTKTILDPACGLGIFMKKILDTGYAGKLVGIDKDPVMINACYLDIKLQYPKNIKQMQLDNVDYLLEDKYEQKIDFLICNPPYLNFHDFDRNLISHIEKKYEVSFSKLTNLYALFIVKAKNSVKHNGKIAFITPSEFFYTGYGKTVKKFMLENFTIESFVTFDFDKTVFDKVLTTSTISFLINKKPNPNHSVKFIKTPKIFNGIEKMKKSNTRKKIYVNIIKQNKIDYNKKWQSYFSDMIYSGLDEKLVPLNHEAKVKRGIATGSNDFFILSSKERDDWGIEDDFLVPVISKAIQTQKSYEITKDMMVKLDKQNQKIHLLYCFDNPSKNLYEYIEHGEKQKINTRYLCAHRTPWYSMEKRNSAPILSTVFSRDNMRFIHNKTNCLNLASYHGIYPNYNEDKKIKALLCYLNSEICNIVQKQYRREYGNGLHKFEPNDLLELPIIPISDMANQEIEELSSLFENMTYAGLTVKSRQIIDKKVHEIVESI